MSSLLSYDNFVHALAGSVANGTAMACFYPLDTVRSRLQLDEKRKDKNTWATMSDIIREEGISSLYSGLEPVLYSLFASGFVYFYSFHGLRRISGEKTALKDLTIGAIAGAINVLTTTPLWVVNTRIRMQRSKALEDEQESDRRETQVHFESLSDGIMKIIQGEGLSALWSGTQTSLILVSNPAVQFMIFEMLKRNLQRMRDGGQLSAHQIFVLGAISKSISTVLSYPLQVVQSKKRYGSTDVKDKSTIEILRNLLQTGTLYKGMDAKLTQTVMTTALMYVFYDKIYNFVTKVSKSI